MLKTPYQQLTNADGRLNGDRWIRLQSYVILILIPSSTSSLISLSNESIILFFSSQDFLFLSRKTFDFLFPYNSFSAFR